jgi:hypothetical protein
MVLQGYQGYNVILYNGTYYAIPQSAGAFDIQKIKSGGYNAYFTASSIAQLEQLIDASFVPPVSPPGATLVLQGYKGYNIVLYNGTYYAILQNEGAFDIQKLKSGSYSSHFSGDSLSHVEQLIDASSPPVPVLVLQGYNGYNIVLYNGTYYAILQSQGAWSVGNPYSFSANSLDQVQRQIDEFVSPPQPILVVQGYRGYNVIQYGSTYYALPQSAGPFDIVKIRSAAYDSYFASVSVAQVERLVLLTARFS